MARIASFLLLALSAAACGAETTVIHVENVPNGGIAFFPLVAVNQEVQQYQQRWARLDISISESLPVDAKNWKDVTLVNSVLVCGDTPKQLAAGIDAVRAAFVGATHSHSDVITHLQQAMAATGTCKEDPPLWRSPNEITTARTPSSDQRTVQQLPATKQQFLNIKAPKGGSASADIKLDARGTLSEASASRQDSMPPAFVGALGTVAAAALTAAGGLIVASIAPPSSTQFMSLDGQRVPKPVKAEPLEPVVLGVSITVVPLSRTYTLTTIWPLTSGSTDTVSDGSPNPCLVLETFASHAGGCLDSVSVAIDASSSPPTAPVTASKEK